MRTAAQPAMPAEPKAPRATVILVDDDPLIVDALTFTLADEFTVVSAATRAQARALLHRLEKPPALALIDLGLPPTPHSPEEGFGLIAELLAHRHAMKIMVLSGQSDRGNVQHALSLGAVDFLPKPCDADLLRTRLRHQLMILEAESSRLVPTHVAEELLIGHSQGLETLRALIKQFANSPFPVLIEGESGAGKELVAMCLHGESRRAAEPLLSLNCSAFSPELLEAQLFGAAKGAYTGAERHRIGLFETAGTGTLFLDEVGEMPTELQAKLLRVLENGDYYRLGEAHLRRAAARVVAATNRDLRDAVRRGEFRADLFHRLSVLTIGVPPLRNRGDDWSLLLDHFVQTYRGTIDSFTLTPSAREHLSRYAFPGNIRELRNIVVRLGTKYGGQIVDLAELKPELEPELRPVDVEGQLDDACGKLNEPGFRLDLAVADFERRLINAALAQVHGNLSRAARLLGVNRTTLYSKLSRLGINPPQEL
jgi:DNA-binding NtrC family response regulator